MSKETDAKERRQIARAWTLVAQTGLIVLVATAIGLGVGMYIDRTFSLKYRPATIALSLWGLVSGCLRAYQLIAHQFGKNDADSIAGVYDRLEQTSDDEDDWDDGTDER